MLAAKRSAVFPFLSDPFSFLLSGSLIRSRNNQRLQAELQEKGIQEGGPHAKKESGAIADRDRTCLTCTRHHTPHCRDLQLHHRDTDNETHTTSVPLPIAGRIAPSATSSRLQWVHGPRIEICPPLPLGSKNTLMRFIAANQYVINTS